MELAPSAAKSILKSKTFWFNLAAAVYGVATTTGLVAALPASVAEIIVGVGNIVLRTVTTQPVKLST